MSGNTASIIYPIIDDVARSVDQIYVRCYLDLLDILRSQPYKACGEQGVCMSK